MTTYIGFLRKHGDGTYTVAFPDLPGCTTVGENLALVSAQAGDDLVRHLTALMSFGYPAPAASTEAQLATDTRRGSAELMAFDVDMDLLGIANPLTYHTL